MLQRGLSRALMLTASAVLLVAEPVVSAVGPQRPNPTVTPPVLFESRPWTTLPPAEEFTITATARVTFRDGATAGSMEARSRGWKSIFPGPQTREGSSGAYNFRTPFTKNAWKTVRAGERVAFIAAAGTTKDSGTAPDYCTVDLQSDAPPAAPEDAMWRIEAIVKSAKYVGTGVDEIVLEVISQDLGSNASPPGPRPINRSTITMRSDQRHVLGLLAKASSNGSRCSNVLFEISATRRDDAATAAGVIDYDVWLVHKGRDGSAVREHRQVDGTQRETVFVRFGSLAWTLTGDRRDAGTAGEGIEARILAEITGWIRPDGRIDLLLGGYEGVGSSAGWMSSGGLRQVTVTDGETTQIVLSQPTGDLSLGAANRVTASAPGVRVAGGKATLDLAKFFEKSEASILVTARRRR